MSCSKKCERTRYKSEARLVLDVGTYDLFCLLSNIREHTGPIHKTRKGRKGKRTRNQLISKRSTDNFRERKERKDGPAENEEVVH